MKVLKKVIAVAAVLVCLVLLWGTWRNNTGLISRAATSATLVALAALSVWFSSDGGPARKMIAGTVAMVLLMAAFHWSCAAPVGDPVHYVALGDSYASGEGARTSGESYTSFSYFGDGSPRGTTDDSPPCHRSLLAYPGRLARSIGQTSWLFAACTGAVVADICRSPGSTTGSEVSCDAPGAPDGTGRSPTRPTTPAQLDQLRFVAGAHRIDLVTVTIGGNDLFFADLLSKCVTSRCLEGPSPVSATFDEQIRHLPAALVTTFRAIRSVVGQSVPVLVVGYPRILDIAHGCGSTTGLSRSEREWMDGAVERTDTIIRDAATAASAFYVDTYNVFQKHLVCSIAPFAHGLVTPGVDNLSQINDFDPFGGAFHPTPDGHACLADTILATYPEPTRLDPATVVSSSQPRVGSASACR